MIRDTAGQKVGAQMVSATDGSAFTGSVTVAVTVDAGTQATGTVGSGACAHEGGGFHTYAPSQAETNGAHLAYTFTGSGAIPVTVQVYTVAGDAFTRLGAPAGASIAADLVVIDNFVDDLESRLTSTRAGYLDNLSAGAVALQTSVDDLESRLGTPSNLGSGATVAANLADIEGQTDDIGAAGAGLTALASASALSTLQTSVDDLPTNAELSTALGAADDAVLAAIAALNNLSQANIRTAVGLASANLDTQLGDLPTNAELSTALASADDAILAAIAALNNLSSAQAQTAAAAALTAYDPPTNAELEARTLTAAQIAKLVAHLTGVLTVIVGNGSTTTSVVLNASTGINGGVPSSSNDFYNGRVLVFISGALAGQATDVTDYVGSTVTATVTALTAAPSAADTAILV